MARLESHGFVKAYLPRDVWARHVMGIFQRARSYVITKISSKAGWVFGCYTKLSLGYRSPYACGKLTKEGLYLILKTAQSNADYVKDLTSGASATVSLPLIAIPHVINPSMANSLLSDLLPRLNHSHPSIRKKTIVTLFRLALVFPETLRPAWPKIKERLLDDGEDPSVTAAIVNVVCELGWRRPQDFLPLAPRLFELLVDGSNNWMGIKIIKLVSLSYEDSELHVDSKVVRNVNTA